MKPRFARTISHWINLVLWLLGICAGTALHAGAFSSGPSMNVARMNHTATILPNGNILVVGGAGTNGTPLSDVEIFDTTKGTWTITNALSVPRFSHTATLLPNGRVMIVGGVDQASVASAEIFDASTGTWSLTASMTDARTGHTATLLPNGKVLIVGGSNATTNSASAEIFDPVAGTWTTTGAMSTARSSHIAQMLLNNEVLVCGGTNDSHGALSSAEIYNIATGAWRTVAPMLTPRSQHSASLLLGGKVLVIGGSTNSAAEIFDLLSNHWTGVGGSNRRFAAQTAFIVGGQILVSGGFTVSSNKVLVNATADLYDTTVGSSSQTGSMNTPRFAYATVSLKFGAILIIGGYNTNVLRSTELFYLNQNAPGSGNWSFVQTTSMNLPRMDHTATLLTDGRVLVTGGETNFYSLSPTTSAEIYDSVAGAWSLTGDTLTGHTSHTATLLTNGQVLVVGGSYSPTSAELYNPISGTWAATGSLIQGRSIHTATLLENGQVLVCGGDGDVPGYSLSSAELYDPRTGTWTPTGPMNFVHRHHAAARLPNGKVLVTAGYGADNDLSNTAELYDPETGSWTATTSMPIYPGVGSATMLYYPRRVLVGIANYFNGSNYVAAGALYDFNTETWSITSAVRVHSYASATLLPDGYVELAGGYNNGEVNSVDVFQPELGSWFSLSLRHARKDHVATLLPYGQVLVTGGYSVDPAMQELTPLAVPDIYNQTGYLYSTTWQPKSVSVSSTVELGNSLRVNGLQFRGLSSASTGTFQDSATDHPLVQLHSIESGRTMFLCSTNWSGSWFVSLPLMNFPPGYASVTVFVNGIPSDSQLINIPVPVPTPVTAMASAGTNGNFQFSFTNTPGATFLILRTYDISAPLNHWTLVSPAVEISPGVFQFHDSTESNSPARFYSVRPL